MLPVQKRSMSIAGLFIIALLAAACGGTPPGQGPPQSGPDIDALFTAFARNVEQQDWTALSGLFTEPPTFSLRLPFEGPNEDAEDLLQDSDEYKTFQQYMTGMLTDELEDLLPMPLDDSVTIDVALEPGGKPYWIVFSIALADGAAVEALLPYLVVGEYNPANEMWAADPVTFSNVTVLRDVTTGSEDTRDILAALSFDWYIERRDDPTIFWPRPDQMIQLRVTLVRGSSGWKIENLESPALWDLLLNTIV